MFTPQQPPEPAPRKNRPHTVSANSSSSTPTAAVTFLMNNNNNTNSNADGTRLDDIVTPRKHYFVSSSATPISSSKRRHHQQLFNGGDRNDDNQVQLVHRIQNMDNILSKIASTPTPSSSSQKKSKVISIIDDDVDDHDTKNNIHHHVSPSPPPPSQHHERHHHHHQQFFSPQNLSPKKLLGETEDVLKPTENQINEIIHQRELSPASASRSSTTRHHRSPYFLSHQLTIAPSPPPPHHTLRAKDDPRPFILGLPRHTERSRRKDAHAENLAELKRRSDRGALIGEEMDTRSEIVCQWSVSSYFLVANCFSATMMMTMSDDGAESTSSSVTLQSAKQHYMIWVEELYMRQILSLRNEVEEEQAREHRQLIFELRRDVFVLSRSVRACLRKFIQDWYEIRRAKIFMSFLKRENMCDREAKVRNDILQQESYTVGDLMMRITVEMCDVSKRRLAAFMMAMQRGIWTSTLCKSEEVQRRNIIWGETYPMPPRDLVTRVVLMTDFVARDATQRQHRHVPYDEARADPSYVDYSEQIFEDLDLPKNIMLSLQCAELSHRDVVWDEELFERDQLLKQLQRSHLESNMMNEKREMFTAHFNFMVCEFLPRAATIIQYHHRRDVENAEFQARGEVEENLLQECSAAIQQSIDEWKVRSQRKIIGVWRRYVAKEPFRQRQLAIFKEILRQEREHETAARCEEMQQEFSQAASQAIVEVIEPQFRFGIEEPSWQESFTWNVVINNLVQQHHHPIMYQREYYDALAFIPDALRRMLHQFDKEVEAFSIQAEQQMLDVAAHEHEVRTDMFERFELHRRLKSQLDELEEEVLRDDDDVDHQEEKKNNNELEVQEEL